LKPATGTAGAGIVSSELFDQFLVAVNDLVASFDLRLRRITSAPFARSLVESAVRRIVFSLP
jgi:hypothetical protein